jgi:WhiB family transcriptional regulator, redox-sensing transcriptional regulator
LPQAAHNLPVGGQWVGCQRPVITLMRFAPMNQLAVADSRLDWLDLGACRDEDPDLFFPIASAGPGLTQVTAAKAVCARCSVRAACLSFALEAGQDHGVWGGTSEDERRALRRSRDGQPVRLAS